MKLSVAGHKLKQGFALPTVLIASVVLLTVLAVSVTATTAARTTLKDQYYAQLAQIAGEAGVAYAQACLQTSGNVPTWTDAKPLTPATDCNGDNALSANVSALVVAGGGGGGSRHGGGGGGGGVIYNQTVNVTATNYPVVVGAGGAGTADGAIATQNNATSGSNSSVFGLNAIGGGAGRGNAVGLSGGSGGGGGNNGGSGGSGTLGQGNNGGAGTFSTEYMGGGGGGAGAAGQNAVYPSNREPAGGVGVANSITGTSVTYSAGGRGGNYSLQTVAVAGAPNTGNGGGGAGGETNGGATGGSGVVIISYPTSSGITATGGTVTTSGGNTIHRFTSSGTFAISSTPPSTCPGNSQCFVSTDDNVRSSFSVGRPTVDSDGRAVTIPQNGFVELVRESTGAVWRTYRQPTTQPVVVPALCSGAATSALGWSNAAVASSQISLAAASAARTISISSAQLNAGQLYFRKDFNIAETGVYDLSVHAGGGTQTIADAYVDSTFVAKSTDALASAPVTLEPGCHTMTVQLSNVTIPTKTAHFVAALVKQGGSIPTVITDTTWRVSAGAPVSYSDSRFNQLSPAWAPARIYNNAGWSGNRTAMNISTAHSYDGSNNYPGGYSYYRDQRSITLEADTEIRTSFFCDDLCVLYVNGQSIMQGNIFGVATSTSTLPPGTYNFAVRLQNGSGPAYFHFTAFRNSDNTILSQSDGFWEASNVWTASALDLYSYEREYMTSPDATVPPTVSVLAVGGGGGGGSNHGGGGGGGGVISRNGLTLKDRQYSVVVGAGGAGGVSNGFGGIGGASRFGNLVYALGGGGGGGRIANNSVSVAQIGGSGGGGAGTLDGSSGPALGAFGTIGQGNRGGGGSSDATAGNGGGGGGASVVGGNASGTGSGGGISGAGGDGLLSSISGSSTHYSGGGAGGRWAAGSVGSPGLGGGGTGGNDNSVAGGPGAANTGGGGGGGGGAGAAGGAGGSGVVIISYPTGSMVATGGTITTSGGNTIHRFTSSGTFTVISVSG